MLISRTLRSTLGKIILFCELEPDNRYSRYAFVVKNEDNRFVGLVLAELSKIFNKFFIRIRTN